MFLRYIHRTLDDPERLYITYLYDMYLFAGDISVINSNINHNMRGVSVIFERISKVDNTGDGGGEGIFEPLEDPQVTTCTPR